MAYSADKVIELKKRICVLVANGSNLHKIGKLDDFPSRETIYVWLDEDKEFSDNYARAREIRADLRVEKIEDIIQDMRTGVIDHQMARVEIDSIKWQAGKEKPRDYGDSVLNKHANADGSNITMAQMLGVLDGRTASIPSLDEPTGESVEEIK